MTFKITVAVAVFSIAMTCCLLSGYVIFAMIGEVNRKMPEAEKISFLGGHIGKYELIFREYRRLYPEGRLHRVAFALILSTGVAMAFFAYWLWSTGIG